MPQPRKRAATPRARGGAAKRAAPRAPAAKRAAPRARRAAPTNPAQRGYSLGRRGAGMQGAGGPVPATKAAPRRKPVAATKRAALPASPRAAARAAGLLGTATPSRAHPNTADRVYPPAGTPTQRQALGRMMRESQRIARGAAPATPAAPRRKPVAAKRAAPRRAARPAAPRARRRRY
jgi:hypothetical protein